MDCQGQAASNPRTAHGDPIVNDAPTNSSVSDTPTSWAEPVTVLNRVRVVAWLLFGVGIGVGLVSMNDTWGLVVLAVSILLAVIAGWRWTLRDSWLGWVASTAVPAGVLIWSAEFSGQCGSTSQRFSLKDGKPAATCHEIVASQFAMGTLFAIFAILALVSPWVIARSRT